jgi:hypothetical protein
MRDQEFTDLQEAYARIWEYQGELVSEERPARRKPSESYDKVKKEIDAKNKTERGITGGRVPKPLTAKQQHELEKRRRKEEQKRKGEVPGGDFTQYRMTGSRGHGSEYSVNSGNPRISYRHNEEYLIDYLLGEGFAFNEKSAQAIYSAMSEEWKQSIAEEIGIVGPPKKGIDKIPGVRGLRIAASNAVKASDYPAGQNVPMAGKHVIPTERSTPAVAKSRPYTRSEINQGALSGVTGNRAVGFKDISGD